jgi:hypothetical protein
MRLDGRTAGVLFEIPRVPLSRGHGAQRASAINSLDSRFALAIRDLDSSGRLAKEINS